MTFGFAKQGKDNTAREDRGQAKEHSVSGKDKVCDLVWFPPCSPLEDDAPSVLLFATYALIRGQSVGQ